MCTYSVYCSGWGAVLQCVHCLFSSPSPAMQRELPSPIIPDDLIPKFVEIQHGESHTAV